MDIGFLVAIVLAASCWFLSARYTAVRVAQLELAQRASDLLAVRGPFRDRIAHTDGHGNIKPGPYRDRDDDGNGSAVVREPGRHAVRRDHYRFSAPVSAGRRRAGGSNAEALA